MTISSGNTLSVVVIRHSIRNRGGDKLVLDYSGYLASKGHAVVFFTNEVNTLFEIDPRIQIKKIPWPGVWGTLLFTAVTRFKTDILLVDLVVMSVVASIFNHRRVVYLAQDDDRSYYSSLWMKILITQALRMALTWLKIPVMAVSASLAQQLSSFAKGKMRTIPNGVNDKVFYPEISSRFMVEKTTRVAVILFARSDYRKGFDVGVSAIEDLARQRGVSDWELWLIGSDPVKINIPLLKVKRFGFLNDDDLRAVFSAADIYLLPSRHEGLSLLLLGALACRLCVVATTAGNILTHEVNALVSKVEDWNALARNLNRVMDDNDLCEKLRVQAIVLAQQYSFLKSCHLFESTLLEIRKAR